MKQGKFRQSPRQQEHSRLDADFRKARGERLRRAVTSTKEDPHAVQQNLDALETKLHRIIDESSRTFLTEEEEILHAAKSALIELLNRIQSDLTKNGARLLRDDDWVLYVDGIVGESVKMYPADNVMDPITFKEQLLSDPDVAEKLQTLKRISAEHSHAQISTVMDEYVQEIRDKTIEAAFLYRSPKEIAENIAEQVEHIAKRIGLNPEQARKEYKAWGEQQADNIMLRRYQHIFDIAFKTAYEQDPELSDPEHLREMVRHIIARQSWENFDFDAGYDGYIQSDEFFGEYRERFLKEIRNEPLRNDIEQLLQTEDMTVVIHQLAEKIEVYIHALPGQKMKQLGFLAGIQFERWSKRQQLPPKMRAFYSDEFDAQQEAELERLQAKLTEIKQGLADGTISRSQDLNNEINNLNFSIEDHRDQRFEANVAETLSDYEASFSTVFGSSIELEQCQADINTLLQWEGAFDPLVERLTTAAIGPYLDWFDQFGPHGKVKDPSKDQGGIESWGNPSFARMKGVLRDHPFLNINQMLTSARGSVVSLHWDFDETYYYRDYEYGRDYYYENYTLRLKQHEITFGRVHRNDKKEKGKAERALQELENGIFPKKWPSRRDFFTEYYFEQRAGKAITALREGRPLPDDRMPETDKQRSMRFFGDHPTYKNMLKRNHILRGREALIKLLQQRQQKRVEHGID